MATTRDPDLIPPADGRDSQLQALQNEFKRVFRALNRLRGRDTHLAGEQLSNAQFQLLTALDEGGEMSAGELAAAAMLTPGTVTQMLEHLAVSGHVARDRSPVDRRVVVSRLTPQGRRKIQAKQRIWKDRWEQALRDVQDEDLQAAVRVLERLGDMVEIEAPPACAKAPQAPPQAAA